VVCILQIYDEQLKSVSFKDQISCWFAFLRSR